MFQTIEASELRPGDAVRVPDGGRRPFRLVTSVVINDDRVVVSLPDGRRTGRRVRSWATFRVTEPVEITGR